jgi:hypothetical protein
MNNILTAKYYEEKWLARLESAAEEKLHRQRGQKPKRRDEVLISDTLKRVAKDWPGGATPKILPSCPITDIL